MPPDCLKQTIVAVLSGAQPPDNPIIAPGWGGLAFDRNRYSDLAPVDVWGAWFDAHRRRFVDSDLIWIVSADDLTAEREGLAVPPRLASLRSYWREGERFLWDHYVVSPSAKWVVRLDQDVTLFVAQWDFLADVVDQLQGLDDLLARMVDDFDPGEGDPVGLHGYLVDLTRGLR